jgi:hypothetical protein
MSTILQKINTDRILSVSAILIGLMTLIVYFIQTRLIIDQQHAGVWPCVEFSGTNYSKETKDKEFFSVNVINKGIGPAIIRKVEIKYKGKTYHEFSDVFDVAIKSGFYIHRGLEGRTMASNEVITPIEIPLSKQGHHFAKLFYSNDSTKVKIYYQSVYGKCFVSSGFDAKELPDCRDLEQKK